MAVKSSEIRSGIFVVLATIALTILIFSVGNFRASLRSAARFYTYVTDAKFLKTHDAVTYGGYKVGEIKAIEVAPEKHGMVRITVEVEPEVTVKEDSTLAVKQDGILGPKYLEITPGSPNAKTLASGATIPGVVPTAFVELGPSFEGPLSRLDKLLENLNAIVGDAEFRKNLSGLLSEARAALAGLNEQVQKLGTVAAKTAEKSQEVLAEVQDTFKTSKEPLAKTIKDADELTLHLTKNADLLTEKIAKSLDELTAKLSKTTDSLDQLLKDADTVVLQNNKNIFETIRGLRDTTHHLELAAKRIRANPSLLLFGGQETPEELQRADETELRLKGRARRYDKEEPK